MKYRFKFSDFSPICRSRREFGRDFRWWPDGTDRGRNLCVARKVSHNFFRVACLPRINKCTFFASRFTLLTKAYSVDWKSSGVYLQGTLTPFYLQISLIFRSKYWMKLNEVEWQSIIERNICSKESWYPFGYFSTHVWLNLLLWSLRVVSY